MEIYVLLAFFLFLLSLTDWGNSTQPFKNCVLSTSIIILILFDGLRWESGTDWHAYYPLFLNSLSDNNDIYEIGYIYLNSIIRYLTNDYTVFLLLHACLMYGGLSSFFKRYSLKPIFSLFLFYVLFLPVQGMNRQFLAIVICLFSLKFLLNGQKKYFVLIVLFASLFHSSAPLFLFALFSTKQYRVKTYILSIVLVAFLSNLGFVEYATNKALGTLTGSAAFRLAFYSNEENFVQEFSLTSLIVAYFRRLLWLIPFFIAITKREIDKKYLVFFNMYFWGFLIYLLFNGSILQILVARGGIYFNIFECVIIPYILIMCRKRIPVLLCTWMVFFYGILLMNKGIHSYDEDGKNVFLPYKSLFINQDVRKYVD